MQRKINKRNDLSTRERQNKHFDQSKREGLIRNGAERQRKMYSSDDIQLVYDLSFVYCKMYDENDSYCKNQIQYIVRKI